MKPFHCLPIFFLVTLVSCQNNVDKLDRRQRLSDSTSVTGLTGDAVKLVKTASINFKVKNVEQSTKAVSLLAQKYGGMTYNQNFRSTENGKKELKVSGDSILAVSTITSLADMTVRIPSQYLEAFLFDVADVGYYTANSQLQIEDKSLLYLENILKQNSREDALRTVATRHDTSTTSNIVEVKDEAIQQFIANKSIHADAAYSTVSLTLFQNALVRKEMIANDDLDSYELPFQERLSNSLSAGWESFLSFLLIILNLWMFILVSLLIFFTYRYYQHKRKIVHSPAGS